MPFMMQTKIEGEFLILFQYSSMTSTLVAQLNHILPCYQALYLGSDSSKTFYVSNTT